MCAEWLVLKPRLEGMAFRLGFRELEARTGLDKATLFRLVNGQYKRGPDPRTIRDVRACVNAYEREQDSQMQRTP